MLILAARPNRTRKQVGRVFTLPAPVGGWNARDAYDEMPKTDALVLDDVFPRTSDVRQRNGSAFHANFVGHITAFSRAGATATYFDSSAVLQTAGADTPLYHWIFPNTDSNKVRFSTADVLVAPRWLVIPADTNECLRNRDLTNAVWVKTNTTAALNQTGIDGTANSASRLTATAANGTCLQAIVSAANTDRVFTAFVKWISGTGGNIDITLDNGSTWTTTNFTVAQQNTWYRLFKTQSLANPTVGFRIPTNGDIFTVDYCQEETGTAASSPIATAGAAVTRNADNPTYATGADASTVPDPVETLMTYTSGTTNKFLAVANGCIHDISTSGGAGVPIASGFTNDRWYWVNFGTFIIMCNGADTPQNYNGSTFANTTFTGTGLTVTNLTFVNDFKGRLFFIEKDTLNAWYAVTLGAVGGASGLAKLDLSTYCKMGGTLTAMANWTRDGGAGTDDLAVFITNKGEVLIFDGTDPTSANTWALVGTFRIGAPIGRRCFVKAGADLAVITNDGVLPLSKALPIDRIGSEAVAITDKIRNAFNTAYRSYGSIFGWEGIVYPKGSYSLFNIPTVAGTTAIQYVVNNITGAWCSFSQMNAICWYLYNENLYFGAKNGWVGLADSGSYDYYPDTDGTSYSSDSIPADIKGSFQFPYNDRNIKHFKMARPVMSVTVDGVSTSINLGPRFRLNVDYEDVAPTSSYGLNAGNPGNLIYKNWVGTAAFGRNAAYYISIPNSGSIVTNLIFYSVDLFYESGGVV